MVVRDDRVFKKIFTPEMSHAFETYFAARGVRFIKQSEVKEARGEGRLASVVLADGRTLDCDMLQKARQHEVRFDTVQMPLNVMDAHFRSFQVYVLPELLKEDIGVLGMKSMGSGVFLKSKVVSPIECLHYALTLPTSVVITGIDSMKVLEQAFAAVRDFKPLTHQQQVN